MNNPALSCATLVADIRRLVPAPHFLFLKMGDCVIEVRTSREGLRDELVGYFDEFLCPAAEPRNPTRARPRSRRSGPTSRADASCTSA